MIQLFTRENFPVIDIEKGGTFLIKAVSTISSNPDVAFEVINVINGRSSQKSSMTPYSSDQQQTPRKPRLYKESDESYWNDDDATFPDTVTQVYSSSIFIIRRYSKINSLRFNVLRSEGWRILYSDKLKSTNPTTEDFETPDILLVMNFIHMFHIKRKIDSTVSLLERPLITFTNPEYNTIQDKIISDSKERLVLLENMFDQLLEDFRINYLTMIEWRESRKMSFTNAAMDEIAKIRSKVSKRKMIDRTGFLSTNSIGKLWKEILHDKESKSDIILSSKLNGFKPVLLLTLNTDVADILSKIYTDAQSFSHDTIAITWFDLGFISARNQIVLDSRLINASDDNSELKKLLFVIRKNSRILNIEYLQHDFTILPSKHHFFQYHHQPSIPSHMIGVMSTDQIRKLKTFLQIVKGK